METQIENPENVCVRCANELSKAGKPLNYVVVIGMTAGLRREPQPIIACPYCDSPSMAQPGLIEHSRQDD